MIGSDRFFKMVLGLTWDGGVGGVAGVSLFQRNWPLDFRDLQGVKHNSKHSVKQSPNMSLTNFSKKAEVLYC